MATATEILQVLDSCADAYKFPMLDNGYVYLAATRLSLFRSSTDWALVIEVFGFSPRAGLPDLNVSTFASTLTNRNRPADYVSTEAFENYLRNNPHNESRSFFPLDEGSWQDSETLELLSATSESHPVLRGREQTLPSRSEYARHGIELADPNGVYVYEYCRYLAAVARDEVLATPNEQRVSVAPTLEKLLVLDDWHYPNLVDDEWPSEVESFQQLARVLETGDVGVYRPTTAGNTHWKHWPDGGTL